jgi:hypothetical protein
MMGRLVLVLMMGAGGCAGGGVARPEPERPRALAALLERGALASAVLTLDVAGPDELPDGLEPGAARRHGGRALPAAKKGGLAMARLAGRLVEVAIGDFSAPLVVIDDSGAAPEVLLAGGNVKLLARIPRRELRVVTTEAAVVAPAPGEVGEVTARLGPGLPIERMGRAANGADLMWVRYRDPEVEIVGVVEPRQTGTSYQPARPGELTAGDGELQTPFYLYDRPGGRPFATVWREAGPIIPVARLRVGKQHTLVRVDLSRDVSVTGWVRTLEVEAAATGMRERPQARRSGQWFSFAAEPGHRCVELPRAMRLRDRPRGSITGLVTQSDRFLLLGDDRSGWLQVGIGHPFGLARLWVPARGLRRTGCDRPGREPGTTM